MERKIGIVYSSSLKGWAFLYVTPQERYFLHISEFKSEHLPVLGERVSFEPAPARKPGQLPCAIDAKPHMEFRTGTAQLPNDGGAR